MRSILNNSSSSNLYYLNSISENLRDMVLTPTLPSTRDLQIPILLTPVNAKGKRGFVKLQPRIKRVASNYRHRNKSRHVSGAIVKSKHVHDASLVKTASDTDDNEHFIPIVENKQGIIQCEYKAAPDALTPREDTYAYTTDMCILPRRLKRRKKLEIGSPSDGRSGQDLPCKLLLPQF